MGNPLHRRRLYRIFLGGKRDFHRENRVRSPGVSPAQRERHVPSRACPSTRAVQDFAPMTLALVVAPLAAAQTPAPMRPIFDAHLHYNDDAREPFPLESALALFREHG